MSVEKVFTNADTEQTYIVVQGEHQGDFFWNDEILGYIDMWSRFAKKIGGHIYAINSIDEFNWVNKQLNSDEEYALGVIKTQDAYYNYNGDGTENGRIDAAFFLAARGRCRHW